VGDGGGEALAETTTQSPGGIAAWLHRIVRR
jgi:hypothetical protein